MDKVIALESGYDFITLYFDDHNKMNAAAERLYAYLKRVNFKYLDIQRKNLLHKPGDIPHFHNGVEATIGPHFHVLYPHRPTDSDWAELKHYCNAKLVSIDLTDVTNEEIS